MLIIAAHLQNLLKISSTCSKKWLQIPGRGKLSTEINPGISFDFINCTMKNRCT